MELRYYADTDTLLIQLESSPSTESEEIADNVVLDFDNNNHVVAIEIEHASAMAGLDNLLRGVLPVRQMKASA